MLDREPPILAAHGFGAEVKDALKARARHLIGEGLATAQGRKVIFARNLLATLRKRELDQAAQKIADETGLMHRSHDAGAAIAGKYARRLDLSSGRFAMIQRAHEFQLVPWSPSMERHLGREVSGVKRGQSISWSLARGRNLSP
jgi:hypothetical protein